MLPRNIMTRISLISTALFAISAASLNATTVTYTSQAAFTSASGATLIDDFETFSPKDIGLPTLAHNGILYTALAGSPTPNVAVASPGYNNFGAGVGTTTTSILVSNGNEDFIGTILGSPFSALGMDVYLNGLGPASVQFFSGVNSIGIVSFPTGSGLAFAGITSDTPITSFHFTSTLGAQLNTGIDNVRAASATTSVPDGGSAGMLLGLGMVGVTLFRMKANRSQAGCGNR